ncbi:MAG: hypothetical protein WBQ95_13900 [Terracidiphilus sp.]
MKSAVSETVFALVMSGVAATFAAAVGFVSGIALSEGFFNGEMTQWALILAPATAVVFAVMSFIFVFRKISTYGESPD